jgi:hypothetical protein
MAHLRVSTAKWKVDLASDTGQAIMRQVQTDGVPFLRTLPGFISYVGVRVDSHTSVQVYTWDSAEHAKSGTKQVREWVDQVGIGAHLASIDATEGEVTVAS